MVVAVVSTGVLVAAGPVVTVLVPLVGSPGSSPFRSALGGFGAPAIPRSAAPAAQALPAVHVGAAQAVSISSDRGRAVAVLTSGGVVRSVPSPPGPPVWRIPAWAEGASALAVVRGGSGAYVATSFGRVFALGTARWSGSPRAASGHFVSSPVVSIAATTNGRGYYVLSADGTIHGYSAPSYGSAALGAGSADAVAVVARAANPGYFVATSAGSVYGFGPGERGRLVFSARNLPARVVGIAVDPSTGGFWLALQDGAVLGHGAPVLGAATCRLGGSPISGIAAQGSAGYALVSTTGRWYGFSGTSGAGGAGPLRRAAPGEASNGSCNSTWQAQHALGFYPGEGGGRSAVAKFQSLERMLHRPVSYASEFTDMRSPQLFAGSAWGLLAKPGGLQSLSPKPTLVLSVPLGFGGSNPSPGTAAANFASVSSGAYDPYYAYVARLLVNAGYPDAVVRIGWEFDGNWFPWSARYDPQGYIASYRHVVAVFRGVSPSFRFDWSGSAEFQSQWSRYWPGRAYVDMVGLDIYDQGLHVPYNPFTGSWLSPSLAWSRTYGHLSQADRFAVRHGLPMSLPEWGLSQGGAQLPYSHGGDNPLFVRGMYAWLSTMRPTGPGSLAFASYFDAAPSAQQGSFRLSDFPVAKTAFIHLFG